MHSYKWVGVEYWSMKRGTPQKVAGWCNTQPRFANRSMSTNESASLQDFATTDESNDDCDCDDLPGGTCWECYRAGKEWGA